MSEIDALIKMLAENPLPADDLEAAAKQFDESAPRTADDIDTEDLNIDGVPCQRHTPPGADTARVIMFLHGGGYVFGSLRSHEGLASELARASNCQSVVVDYRLAPAHAFPAAVEDSTKVYRWLLDNGYSSANIVIAGDSAGGGLTVATMVALREQNLALPAAGVCLSPWVDLECKGDSHTSRAEIDPLLTGDLLRGIGMAYAGGNLTAATASPIHADLTGLPPLLIHVGEREVLFSDAENLHKKALAAGVDSSFEEWKDMIHVWQGFYPMLSEGRQAIAKIGEFVQAKLGYPPHKSSDYRKVDHSGSDPG
jgi:monoterpene epsilon-lactone hydrolase